MSDIYLLIYLLFIIRELFISAFHIIKIIELLFNIYINYCCIYVRFIYVHVKKILITCNFSINKYILFARI